MPIFRCEKCNVAENTAVSHFASRAPGSPALCSQCDPEIGKWHGRFPRMSADEFVQKGQYLISKEEDAFEKAKEKYLENHAALVASQPKTVAERFFNWGWREGVEFARKEGKKS